MSFPTTGILDDFQRANVGPPPSSSWTNWINGLKVVSNACKGNINSSDNLSYWNTSYGPDCEVFCTLSTKPGAGYAITLFIRFDFSGAGDGYYCNIFPDGTIQLYKTTPTEGVLLGSTINVGALANGDAFGLSAVGTTLTIYRKPSGGSWTSIGTRTDGDFSGAGNIALDIGDTTAVVDDFGGGAVVTGGGLILPVAMSNYRQHRT